MGFKTLKKSWIFPGQASQKVGMGLDLYENTDLGRNYYDLANDILGEDIKDISFNGPDEKLKITKFTQPAIFIVSTIISHLLLKKGFSHFAISIILPVGFSVIGYLLILLYTLI